MIAVISLLITLMLSLIVTRVATVALMLTGLSRESARFQARSAFTGVGYTTNESESMVEHPMRRQIVMLLMLLGNIGIATVMATMMLSFLSAGRENMWQRNLPLLALGLCVLWVLARSPWVERQLNRMILLGLRRFSNLQVRDYVALLELTNGFTVSELLVEPTDWLAGKTLANSRLSEEGILVLGIKRKDGTYIGAPVGKNQIEGNDTLILYGKIERISELDQRDIGWTGDRAHASAVSEHEQYLEQVDESDE